MNSLHWLAGHNYSILTKSILPSGAIPVTRVFDVSRQCTSGDRCVALSAAQGDARLLCLVVSSELGFLQENGCITPVGVHDCLHIFDVVRSTGRWCLEKQERMRRDPEEIEEVAFASGLQ